MIDLGADAQEGGGAVAAGIIGVVLFGGLYVLLAQKKKPEPAHLKAAREKARAEETGRIQARKAKPGLFG